MARAWVDDDDQIVEKTLAAERPFLLANASRHLPAWAETPETDGDALGAEAAAAAVTNLVEDAVGAKRGRTQELHDVLTSTAPLVSSRNQKKLAVAPRILSILPTGKETAKDVVWHPNGELALVACTKSVKVFHCTGRFVEAIGSAAVPYNRGPQKLLLLPGNEQALVLTDRAYQPFILNLATSQYEKASFMDTRQSAAFKLKRASTAKFDPYITTVAMRPHDTSSKLVATAVGQSVVLHSLATGTTGDTISLNADVTDLCFSGEHELLITAQNKMYVYDVRKSATFVRAVIDDGSLVTTRVAANSSFVALGSSSGVVNVYSRGEVKPTKTLMNLSTSITSIAFGEGPSGAMMAIAAQGEVNGMRLVTLPTCTVTPSFPTLAARHKNIHALAFHPQGSLLSIGEFGKVTNYVLH